ncbi:uncharacterized protein MELLADRAFT_60095 [Melampsora larici-populina 98AG31]|uniref:Uncharacterized protein n=1 Tax=Melampsora larici-populina (strain 98AG31 / pathotype 3-4-7) TaxID=747676 RepID=F4R8Q6_MELLP|nr:uncharacterized protein MELLADRAFT_60095 [Melampsora larici-populina 98AG31]EGG11066.1 hypothetical protein MELLADRAFT_60095 [Melampsora larici-populina 98AG31]
MDVFRYPRLPFTWTGTFTLGEKVFNRDTAYRNRLMVTMTRPNMDTLVDLVVVNEDPFSTLEAAGSYCFRGSVIVRGLTNATEVWLVEHHNATYETKSRNMGGRNEIQVAGVGLIAEHRDEKDSGGLGWDILKVKHREWDNELLGLTEFHVEYWYKKSELLMVSQFVIGDKVTLRGSVFGGGSKGVPWQVKLSGIVLG